MTTRESALLSYTLDTSCVLNGTYSIATELLLQSTHEENLTINKSVIENTSVQHSISDLLPGTVYNYCVIFSTADGPGMTSISTLKLCGEDLPKGGMFTTELPQPPSKLNGATLESVTSNRVTYKCQSDLERFSDGSVVMASDFDSSTQMYTLNGSCTSKLCLLYIYIM